MGSGALEMKRRDFIKAGFIAGTGLVVAFHLSGTVRPANAKAKAATYKQGLLQPNAWIRIDKDDYVTVIVKHSELGQAITTASCMIVAEELEADWSRMRAEIAPVAKVYRNPEFGVQGTGASSSVKTSWDVLRKAGAATKELLISAAAEYWKVSPAECKAQKSTVFHKPSGKQMRYGQLLEKAAAIQVPKKPRLKSEDEFSIIGKRYHRLDTRQKMKGETIYGIDIGMPGLLNATVVHPPEIGGKLKSANDTNAKTMSGIKGIMPIESGVAVVAEHFWQAMRAVEELDITWEKSPETKLSSDGITNRWADLVQQKGKVVREEGDVKGAMQTASKKLSAVYELPFQAHACPEPMNCTAHVRSDRCDIWAPTQFPEAAREVAARITGLDLEAVKVNTTFIGGGFGRRFSTDDVAEAVEVSKKMKAPVKVIWSREEDMRNDYYRPAFYNLVEAGLDAQGLPIAWRHKAVGPAMMDKLFSTATPSMVPDWLPRSMKDGAARFLAGLASRFEGPEATMAGSATIQYGIKNILIEYIKDDPGVPVGPWRGVANSRNAFVVESFMDEIASVSETDPVELRMKLLKMAPKHLGVLQLAAEKAGWGRQFSEGRHQGIAAHVYKDTPAAMVAEISVEGDGQVKVHRVVCAVDCGIVINPKNVEAQIAGGIAFGLSATLKSAVSIKDNRIQESNFDDFPILQIDEMPRVDVYLVKSDAPPAGIGEVGVPPIAPAVANAIFAATGKRIRKLPVDPAELK